MEEQLMQDPDMREIVPSDDGLDLSDDDIAASLGYATSLSEPLIPMDEMSVEEGEEVEAETEVPQEEPAPEEPPAEEVAEEEVEEEPSETEKAILKKLDELTKKVDEGNKKTDIEAEIGRIEKELDALKEDEGRKD